jgi:hypothetical protein
MTLHACTTDFRIGQPHCFLLFHGAEGGRNAVAPLGVQSQAWAMPIATTVARLSGYLLFSIWSFSAGGDVSRKRFWPIFCAATTRFYA